MMDLKINCPHCTAKAGELCTKECSANGYKIVNLDKALRALSLTFKGINAQTFAKIHTDINGG